MTTRTQTERIIKAAGSAKGVSRIDFQLPDVIDGGDPILNFPGRMWDAERLGYCFEVIGKRNRCKVFRLVSEPERGISTPEPSPGEVPPCAGASLRSEPSRPLDPRSGDGHRHAVEAGRRTPGGRQAQSVSPPPERLFDPPSEPTGHWQKDAA